MQGSSFLSNDDDVHSIYDSQIEMVKSMIPNSQLKSRRETVVNGMPALEVMIEYSSNEGINLTCYQIFLPNKNKTMIYFITCTTTTADFSNSKPMFDIVVNSFRL